MGTQLITRQKLTPSVWEMIAHTAPVMYKSRLFGVGSEDQAAAIMLKGYELGLTLTAAFEFIHIIQSKPTISPRGALALIYQSGQLEGMKIEDNGKVCTVWMKRKNGIEYTASFGMEDAKAASLIKDSGGWEKYPKQMRQWRAVGFCADVVFPDVIGGMKRADELGADLTIDGDVIEGSWAAVDNTPKPDPKKATITINDLISEFGPEMVLKMMGGDNPTTPAEIEALREKLSTAQREALDGMTMDNVEEKEF